MSKSIKLKDNNYIDSSSIVNGHTKLSDELTNISNKFQYGYKGQGLGYSSLDEFKAALLTNSFPPGCYLLHISYSYNTYGILVEKANNSYCCFIWFSFVNSAVCIHKYVNGTWTSTNL